MRKTIRKALLIAMALIMALSLAAPVRAEMPVSWLADFLAWYLAQNGVHITVLLPGSDPNHIPPDGAPTVQVFTGYNDHYLTNVILDNDGEFVGLSDYVDRHYGIFYDIPGGTEGLGIEYAFIRHMFMPWHNAPTPYAYSNGLVNGSNEWAGLTIGSPTMGTLAWMVPSETLGSGNASMRITFDFWYQGWHYGVVVDNHVVDAYFGDGEYTWLFTGIYGGARTNTVAPILRPNYVNR
jgi:hypothetical protein